MIEQVFDGEMIKVSKEQAIPLNEIKGIKVVLDPYLIFHVVQVKNGERERTLMKMIYPCTSEREVTNQLLIQGEERSTRSVHFVEEGSHQVTRKIDLKDPHKVELTGHRNLVLKLTNGEEIKVTFDGNCINKLPQVDEVEHNGAIEPLIEFFDRSALILEVAKKQGIQVSSFI